MTEYKDRLAAALAHKGATRIELAAALSCTVQAIGDVLLGKTRAFTAHNNALAAEFLNVNPKWLATGLGSMIAPGQLSADILEVARLAETLKGEQRAELLKLWRWTAEAQAAREAGASPSLPVPRTEEQGGETRSNFGGN